MVGENLPCCFFGIKELYMAKAFNFNKIQRRYWSVTLKNGRTLLVGMPTKGLFEAMAEMQNIDKADIDATDSLYAAMRQILNNNKQGYKFSKEELNNYSFEEVQEFFRAYSNFVAELGNEKN